MKSSKGKPIIEIKNVVKRYKDQLAVDQVSFTINQGEYVALLGPNGAGKTTIVEMIEGIIKPDSGEILIEGLTWKGDDRYLKSILGVSFQETRFMDKSTVSETLKLFCAFYNIGSGRVDEVLELINLSEKKNSYVENLSGGQRQKLAIGIALLNNPKILLLDEPTTGLDPQARREIWMILKNLKNQGRSMILTTHYMEEAEFLCEKILIMHTGRILAQGRLEELLAAHSEGGIIEIRLENETDALKLYDLISVTDSTCQLAEKTIYLKSKTPAVFLKNILGITEEQNVIISDLQVRTMTLDDLFILMAGQHLHE
ncbi:MAG: ABC transporter ATP-binding protein [Spirochaetia bacterium]|nr:ABC transporter ATP-binding protein [Spirochaetia bacterium]